MPIPSRIQKTVQHVEELLLQVKKDDKWAKASANDGTASDELILVIDGAYLHSKDQNSRSFEALIATVYNPAHHIRKDKRHHMICKKTTVASAKQDRQASIKKLTLNACIKEGMQKNTQLTVLSDGAENCWSVISSLKSSYENITTILDWFHIGKKFKNVEHHIPENKQNRKKSKSRPKRQFNSTIFEEGFFTGERIFSWEDKFKCAMIRFEHISQYYFGIKLIAYSMINLSHFCG